MSEEKHTPGPWIWADLNRGLYGAGPDNAVLVYYAYEGMSLGGRTEEQEKANARLIAAAPDLLAALKAAEEYLAFHSAPNCEPMPLDGVRAAIAKAEGRS